MNPDNPSQARLLLPDGTEIVIQGTCTIGRTSGNNVVLPVERVSRRHALIHAQEHGRFCLVDLGSRNGSYVNGRRVTQPVILKDRDQIDIGPTRLVFRDPEGSNILTADGHHTLQEIRSAELWLLVADIIGSTRLAAQVGDTEVPRVTGRWLAESRKQLELLGGTINKFLGDGFLAYWPGDADPVSIADALSALRDMQRAPMPRFRVVLHRGQALLGGAGSLGEENLTGRDVNFVFRMEKLAGVLQADLLLSLEARTALGQEFVWTDHGHHALPGFDGVFSFYGIAPDET